VTIKSNFYHDISTLVQTSAAATANPYANAAMTATLQGKALDASADATTESSHPLNHVPPGPVKQVVTVANITTQLATRRVSVCFRYAR